MSSEIKADLIKDKSGTKTLATLSSSSVTLDSSVVFPAGGTGNPISVAVIADEKSSGSDGGTSSATGSFEIRALNTEISDPDGIVSIASNQFTLGPGTYFINWKTPGFVTNRMQSQLYDVTGTTRLKEGTSEYSNSTQISSIGWFVHTISSNNVYEIRQEVEAGRGSNGLGVGTGFGENCIFTMVVIYKLK